MNIKDQQRAIGNAYTLAAIGLQGFQESQGLEVGSVDEMTLMHSDANPSQHKVLTAFANLFDELDRVRDELRKEENESEDEDEAALKELNAELEELMKQQGFTQWQTGGGCTAWGKYLLEGNDDKSPYIMATVADDATAYFYDLAEAHQKNAISIYFYDSEGANFSGGVYYTWNEFKANFK